MKFGVIVFPGSNCDQDMYYAFDEILDQNTEYIWHKERSLKGFGLDDVILVPGGFSYGDYLRAGAIARFSPVMKAVIEFAELGGHVFGVCNGFQILCECGLLPGVLLRNENQKFISDNIYLKAGSQNLLTNKLSQNEVIQIPIAHADGRYHAQDEQLKEIINNEQVLFYYCDAQGNVTKESNPNGSIENIAGVCNVNRNVFGMMPHPERAIDPALFNEDGRKVLEGLLSLTKQEAA